MKKILLLAFFTAVTSFLKAQSIEISATNATLDLKNSTIKVSGENKSGFIHTVNPGLNDGGSVSIIDNPASNNNFNAILLVTPFLGFTDNILPFPTPVGVFYDTILNRWKLISLNLSDIPTGAKFNIMVIKY